jgi:hypothetical protein
MNTVTTLGDPDLGMGVPLSAILDGAMLLAAPDAVPMTQMLGKEVGTFVRAFFPHAVSANRLSAAGTRACARQI